MKVSIFGASGLCHGLALLFAANILLAGCGGNSSSGNQTVNNPTPAISSLSPASLPTGSAPQTLIINGSGFLASSSVSFKGASRTTTYLSSSQVTIALTSADLSTAASDPVVVSNPAPGGGTSSAVDFTVIPTVAIQGKLEGGEQPIAGAQVYLYAAGTTGTRSTRYGANATSLLDAPGYVTTGSDGSFTGNYDLSACQSAQDMVYIVAIGGDSGGTGYNPATVLMSALGNCANLSTKTSVLVNEVTTVASVVALQQFMNTGAGDYNLGTSGTNVTGLKNAFLAATNLVNTSTGTALATTPNGNGTVPQAEIDSLANIIAACVNSAGGSSVCNNLFSNATPPDGTKPADTLHAMLDIAQNPGNNVQALYDLAPSQAPLAPALTAAPNDWTIVVEYTGGGLNRPYDVAVDASGNLWMPNENGDSVSEFNTLGISLQGSSGIGITTEDPSTPTGLAIDPAGNIWVSGFGSPGMAKLTSTGSYLSTVTWNCSADNIAIDASGDVYEAGTESDFVCKYSADGTVSAIQWGGTGTIVAVDGVGNIWVPSFLPLSIGEFDSSLSMMSGEPSTGWSDPQGVYMWSVAIDAQGNVWAPNAEGAGGSALVTELSSSGSVLSSSGFAISSYASGIAIDGNDTAWTANVNGSISHLAHNGATISPSTGYQASGVTQQLGLAVDASGNLWTAGINNSTPINDYYLVEWVGVAAPVATPLVQNLV
jgi:hypothetical protein